MKKKNTFVRNRYWPLNVDVIFGYKKINLHFVSIVNIGMGQLGDIVLHGKLERLMITHSIESYWIKVKRRQCQSYKFKKFAR